MCVKMNDCGGGTGGGRDTSSATTTSFDLYSGDNEKSLPKSKRKKYSQVYKLSGKKN